MVSFTVTSSGCSQAGIPRYNQNVTPSGRVSRNLFGPVDHDEFREEIRKQNIARLEEKKTEYNFDFEKDVPLPGRYLWEKVSNMNKTEDCSQERAEDRLISKTTSSKILSKTDSSMNKPIKDQEERKITDFFRSKKRKHEETADMHNSEKIKCSVQRDSTCPCLNACMCT